MMIFGCNALALQPFLLLMIDLLRRKPHESVASTIRSGGFRHETVSICRDYSAEALISHKYVPLVIWKVCLMPFSDDERATKKAVRFRTALVIFLLELNYMPNTCLAYSLSGSMVCSF